MERRNGLFRRGARVWWLPNEGSQRQVTIWDDSGFGLVMIVDGTGKFAVKRYELSLRPFQGIPLQGIPLQGIPLQGIPLNTGNDAA